MRYLIFLLLMFSDCSAKSKLIKAAVNISSTYYKQNIVTTVTWKQNKSDCVDGFLENYPGSVVLSPWCDDNDGQIRDINKIIGFKQTIYFASTLHDYATFMKILNEVTRLPILLILVLENSITSELSAYLEVTWKNDQADIIIISTSETQEIKFSTFYPYSDDVCENYKPITLKISDNMFPKKFTNFYQCPVKTAVFKFIPYVTMEVNNGKVTSVGGYDGEVLKIILKKLNASLEVTSTATYSVYGTYINGTATGYIADLVSKKADILIPAGILTTNRYSITLQSHIYQSVDIHWIGPKQRPVQDWLKVIVPDRSNLTPLHGVTFASFIAVTMLVRRCKQYLANVKNHILYQSFIILLGQSAKFITKSSLLNSLFILWIWCCFIFRIDYQADLVDALQSITLEPPFESVEDAIAKMDGYGGAEVFLDYYRNTSLEHAYKLIPMPAIKTYLRRIYEGEKFLLATDVSLVRDVNHNVQILDKQISMIGACFYMRPGWPAFKAVDDVIVNLVEGGFINNIMGRYEGFFLNKKNVDDSEPKGLNFSVVNTCFYGLAVMYVICFIILIIEIIYYKNKSDKHHGWVD